MSIPDSLDITESDMDAIMNYVLLWFVLLSLTTLNPYGKTWAHGLAIITW